MRERLVISIDRSTLRTLVASEGPSRRVDLERLVTRDVFWPPEAVGMDVRALRDGSLDSGDDAMSELLSMECCA
ncbi:hypothetical protein DIE21_19650 [Burkholderia sp. Bp9140]|nr:hypothetical protein DIE21_19650 [Burkholderia sp. Bp9140]